MTIICFLLTLAIGYALFSDTITIEGTANASGNFDVSFVDVAVKDEVGAVNSLAEIIENDNTLSITVPRLEYPGAYVSFEVTVANQGLTPATLTSIHKEGLNDDDNIKISYFGLDELINKEFMSEPQKFNVVVAWDPNSTAASSDVQFSLKLNYSQYISN